MVINSLTARHLGRGRRSVVGIVLHDTAGNGGHGDTLYLANPSDGRTVSVDFTVERDGSIWQLNPDLENNWTYHAGRATQYKGLQNGEVSKHTIGIEITQSAGLDLSPMWPAAQVRAVAELCRSLCAQFGLSRSDITTHGAIITDGSRSDPRQFPFGEFDSYFNGATPAAIGGGNGNLLLYGMAAVLVLVLLD